MKLFTTRFVRNLIFAVLIVFLSFCNNEKPNDNPNIIFVMADDMGYECLSVYGSTSYQTPVLEELASKGAMFTNCISQPLCTPSRVKIMTGQYNYRNYDFFGNLSSDQKTFGNLMKEAGYATCIVGKWQLNGLAYKDQISHWDDTNRPHHFGFDEYCLWQLTKTKREGERFANPLILQNGKVLQTDLSDYGPDIFSNYLLDFIERKKDSTFFIYYPMVLVHDPFVPTPDSKNWEVDSLKYKKDTAYFKDMVEYADKIIGKINNKLSELGLENTILIFTGDNGTHKTIFTQTQKGVIQGGKGKTTDAGTHVPLIINWPKMKNQSIVYEGLIEFSDFYPTFADIVGKNVECDGKSFYPLLTGGEYKPRETVLVHYDPRWSKSVNQYRNRFARTVDYKLYQDGNFYNLKEDVLEQNPLKIDSLSEGEKKIHAELVNELKKHPEWK